MVWVVPLIAATVAGTLVYNRLQEVGPTITIKLRDGSGVKADQTEIRYQAEWLDRMRKITVAPAG